MTGTPDETVGHQLGTIAKLIIWLVGIMAALRNSSAFGQILAPINELVTEIFAFLPHLIAAGLIFFVGSIVARIVKRLVETVLIAANVDGLLARIGIGSTRRAPCGLRPTPCRRAQPPAATRASIARAAGVLVYALIIIPVAIAALQVLGIDAISGSRNRDAERDLAAPSRISSPPPCGSESPFIAARFLKTIIEAILPPTGFDDAIRSTGVLPANASPSRIVANIAMIAIILAAAIEAAKQARRRHGRHLPRPSHRARRQGDLRNADHRRRNLARADHRQPGRKRNRRGRLRADHHPLRDHRPVHGDRPHVHGPGRPDRDDGFRPDPGLGARSPRHRIRPRRTRCRGARRSSAGRTMRPDRRCRRRGRSGSARRRLSRPRTSNRRWSDDVRRGHRLRADASRKRNSARATASRR